jgi:hypothetical protein
MKGDFQLNISKRRKFERSVNAAVNALFAEAETEQHISKEEFEDGAGI